MKKIRLVSTAALASVVVMMCFLCLARAEGDDPPKITKPVPVVQPPKDDPKDDKKPEKKTAKDDDTPPSAAEETSGVMPLGFVKNKVDIMPVGTKAYVSLDTVKCNSKRQVFLDPDQVYGTQNEGRVVLVNRTSAGYHITLEKIDNQWTCQELPTGVKWIPVKTVTSR